MKIVIALAVVAVLAAGAAVVVWPSAEKGSAAETQRLDVVPLAIETATGRKEFRVEVARTSDEQAQGLMFRHQLARDAGMLFVHQRPHVAMMWMRNTYIPLDMLFIGADGRIARIAERAVPQSEATISSGVPVIAVLEVAGGTASRLGLKPGDRVTSPALGGG